MIAKQMIPSVRFPRGVPLADSSATAQQTNSHLSKGSRMAPLSNIEIAESTFIMKH